MGAVTHVLDKPGTEDGCKRHTSTQTVTVVKVPECPCSSQPGLWNALYEREKCSGGSHVIRLAMI